MSKVRSELRMGDFRRGLAYAGVVTFSIMLLAACGPALVPDLAAPTIDQPTSESADPLQATEEGAAEEGYPVQDIEESTAEDAYPGEALPLPIATIDLENYPPPAKLRYFLSLVSVLIYR